MKLDHIVLLVRSLDTSLPWYSALLGLLGFEKTRDHVWYDGELAFDLKEAEPDTAEYERYAPGEAALDRVRDGMAAAGLEVPEKQNLGGMIATFFKDPDGMRIEVTVYA